MQKSFQSDSPASRGFALACKFIFFFNHRSLKLNNPGGSLGGSWPVGRIGSLRHRLLRVLVGASNPEVENAITLSFRARRYGVKINNNSMNENAASGAFWSFLCCSSVRVNFSTGARPFQLVGRILAKPSRNSASLPLLAADRISLMIDFFIGLGSRG